MPAASATQGRQPASHAQDAPRDPPSSRRSARLKSASFSPESAQPAAPESVQGAVAMIDGRRNLAHVHFASATQPLPVGSRLRVLVPASQGHQVAGEVEVVQSFAGSATVRGLGHLNLVRIGRDAVIVR